ncbi:unnamed protein product [Didymodactylos carnosus]|uniref:Uncharacterized protein n=1 Tax=Didymodactylos carnosus TaxID=1234261 RepID=A0A8S2GV69_9BILA|nr:unnamed protein product [Didymodactylos carnosus]CAF3565308.1 unnamed protein product [Didymodactylos carnosus]
MPRSPTACFQAEKCKFAVSAITPARDKLNEEDAFKELGIKIEFKQINAFEELQIIDNLGVRDPKVSEVFTIPFDRYANFINNRSLAPLPDGGNDDFAPSIVSQMTGPDQLVYGMALNISPLVMYSNGAPTLSSGADLINVLAALGNGLEIAVTDLFFGAGLFMNLPPFDLASSLLYRNENNKVDSALARKDLIAPIVAEINRYITSDSEREGAFTNTTAQAGDLRNGFVNKAMKQPGTSSINGL